MGDMEKRDKERGDRERGDKERGDKERGVGERDELISEFGFRISGFGLWSLGTITS